MPSSIVIGCTSVIHNAIDCYHSNLPVNEWCEDCAGYREFAEGVEYERQFALKAMHRDYSNDRGYANA